MVLILKVLDVVVTKDDIDTTKHHKKKRDTNIINPYLLTPQCVFQLVGE